MVCHSLLQWTTWPRDPSSSVPAQDLCGSVHSDDLISTTGNEEYKRGNVFIAYCTYHIHIASVNLVHLFGFCHLGHPYTPIEIRESISMKHLPHPSLKYGGQPSEHFWRMGVLFTIAVLGEKTCLLVFPEDIIRRWMSRWHERNSLQHSYHSVSLVYFYIKPWKISISSSVILSHGWVQVSVTLLNKQAGG